MGMKWNRSSSAVTRKEESAATMRVPMFNGNELPAPKPLYFCSDIWLFVFFFFPLFGCEKIELKENSIS